VPNPEHRVWPARLRWRLRGASQWPALWALTAADAAIAHWLPYSENGYDLIIGFVLFGFANLALVAAGGPLAAGLVQRARRDLPRAVAADRAATILMLALTALLLFAGL